jgi:hypothetical protein
MIAMYKTYYGNDRYNDMFGQYTPQSKLVNFPFNFNNLIQRGLLIGILLNKKAVQQAPDEFFIEDILSAFNATVESNI